MSSDIWNGCVSSLCKEDDQANGRDLLPYLYDVCWAADDCLPLLFLSSHWGLSRSLSNDDVYWRDAEVGRKLNA